MTGLTDNRVGFESLSFVQRIRELREITGGSKTCGWAFDEITLFLYTLVKWYKPELIIQTGHLWGKSALAVTEALNDGFLTGSINIEEQKQKADLQYEHFATLNSPASIRGEVVSIDPKPISVPHYNKGVEYVRSLHKNFRFYEMTSNNFFENFDEIMKSDLKGTRIMGIVDGDHSWLGCLSDLENLKDLGAELIFVDDTSWLPHIRKVCQAFANDGGYEFYDFRAYNGFGLLVKEKEPPEHSVDGDYSGLPYIGHIAIRVVGAKSTIRVFNMLKAVGACSPTGNRLTLGTGLKNIIRYGVGRLIRLYRGREVKQS